MKIKNFNDYDNNERRRKQLLDEEMWREIEEIENEFTDILNLNNEIDIEDNEDYWDYDLYDPID